MAREKMAARVGASLSHSMGMSQMITRNLDEYVDLAISLGLNRKQLKSLRSKLRKRRGSRDKDGTIRTAPTYDLPRWLRQYEKVLKLVVDIRRTVGKSKRFHIVCS
mmetsp:Transcript_41943/g.65539  ORF Transcript_41943/g.65539 Transcript_41943/m.65539 type:complete len:106 (+) Transcript_41943:213-530(+)